MTQPSEIFAFGDFPELTTQRLLLRELTPDDAQSVLAFRGDPEVQKFNSEPLKDVAEAKVFIDELIAEYRARRQVVWAVTEIGASDVIGTVSLQNWNSFHRRVEIGYDLLRARWGHGIASEAVRAVIEFAFGHMRVQRIEADTIADNARSVRMLERFGFRREGTRREYSLEDDGVFHDGAIYSLLAKEWPA